MHLIPLILSSVLLAAPLALTTADDRPGAAQTPPAKPADAIPTSLFASDRPKDAKHIKDVKASTQKGELKKGDTVTLQGRIAGRKEPFIKGRAMFVLADLRLPACNEKPDDLCPTPWDLCCETPESLKANTATIQIVGADGKILKVGAEGTGGLVNLAKLVVVGTVAEVSKEGALVVSATSIYVEPTVEKSGKETGKEKGVAPEPSAPADKAGKEGKPRS